MADVPAWYWQVLGAVGGLGLGLFIGAVNRRKPSDPPSTQVMPRPARPAQPGAAPVAGSGEPRLDATSQRLLERLREANLDLTARLRAATDQHARDLLERSQQQQAEQQRHERQIEELRQTHANELSHLMTDMVEQVDAMQREHVAKLTALQDEIEQLKRISQTIVDPVTMHMGGDMHPAPPPAVPARPRS
ncbi:hypothetical protein [Ideonella sp. B508-1]|uniref:hypothetical protein n=1 Tax=Ideonella sp. B508-1 TaxID=137716 RepID=UPI0003B6CE33|nr:hypothetical protein [Ideonella sp. B508-1]